MSLNIDNINLLGTIERVMIITAALLIIYTCIIFSQEKVERVPRSSAVQTESLIVSTQNMMEPLKSISSYAEQLGLRDVFNFAPPGSDTSHGQPLMGAGQTLPGNLKIVGVIIGHPSEVIIEDSQAQQTYFVKEGEAVGFFQVFQASKERVTLEYQGQSFEVDLRQ